MQSLVAATTPAARPRALPAATVTVVAAAASALLLVCWSLVVVTRRDAWEVPALADQPVDLAIAVSFSSMGALVVLAGRSSRRLGLLLLAVGAAAALTVALAAYAATVPAPTPAARVAVQVNAVTWVFGVVPLVTLVPLTYPEGRLPGPRWRPVAGAAAVGTVLLALATGLHGETFEGLVPLDKPLVADAVAGPLGLLGAVLVLVATVASLVELLLRWRRSRGLARRQIAVLLAAAALLVADLVVTPLLQPAVRTPAQVVAVLLLPVAMGVAVTRHRLFDLDLTICRALVGLSVAACLTGLFLTLFALLRTVLGHDSMLATALAAAGTALLLQPLAARLSCSADRLLYGDRGDPYAVLTRFSGLLRDGLPLDELPRAICERVLVSLRLSSARLVVGDVLTEAGTPSGPSYSVPLVHRGREVGLLTVTPRSGEQRVAPRDQALLDAIAAQVAPSISSVHAWAELRRSREALVAAREEERRRLRRDLHDGVGAALAGVRLQLESARALVEDPRAGRLLDAAGTGVADAVQDVRRLTEDLRPPALDELGLTGALRALGDRVAGPGRRVDVDVEELPVLPAAVEVAGYRVAAEALTNAVRHSGGGVFRVSAHHDRGWLVLEVADDGTGLPAEPRSDGVGLTSMRQRAEEVGGRLRLSSGPGTTVRVELPVEPA